MMTGLGTALLFKIPNEDDDDAQFFEFLILKHDAENVLNPNSQ